MPIGSVIAASQLSASAVQLAVLLGHAEEARLRGDYRAGTDLARRGAALAASSGDGVGQARALRSLATQLLRLGEQEASITACSEAVALLETARDAVGLCETLTAQAMPYNELGLHQEALEVLGRAHKIAQRLDDRALLYWVHNRTGVVHGSMGAYAQSTECLMHALTMVDGMDDEARFCIFNNLGDNAVHRVPELRESGDEAAAQQTLDQALGYVQEALRLARTAGHPFRESISIDNYGMLLALARDHDRAVGMIEDSRAIAVIHGYRSLEAAALQHLAQVRLMRGEHAAAVDGLLAALERAVEAGEKPMAKAIHHELTIAYERCGDFASALRHYREFHQLEREAHNDVAATRARMMIHNFELDNARLEAANARLETELHRIRSVELEADKQSLQRRAVELDRHAHEDALTGLANRRFVEVRLPEMIAVAQVTARPLCVAIADLDHFKDVNDRFGHQVGDEVLRQIGALMRDTIRGIDLVARLGGEEFMVGFEDVTLRDAYRICELLRECVAEYHWESLHPGLTVTISIGVAERTGATDHQALMALADERLYAAKRNGRNRVEIG